jgi:cyclopropane fatty-acyl-phospholipid synthase-like methyltransferase
MVESKLKPNLLKHERYPLSAKYDPEWIFENSLGSQSLWLTESLCRMLPLESGMRVLDLGCGRMAPSIFLAREFGVHVWGVDTRVDPTENLDRIKAMEVEDRVYPMKGDARSLPFPEGFFDVVLGINTFQFFATDELYPFYAVKLLKSGGRIAFIVPALMKEFDSGVPEHLRQFWDPTFRVWHTADWWRRHWEGVVDIECIDYLEGEDGWRLWALWQEAIDVEDMVRRDAGRYISFLRFVSRRQ